MEADGTRSTNFCRQRTGVSDSADPVTSAHFLGILRSEAGGQRDPVLSDANIKYAAKRSAMC